MVIYVDIIFLINLIYDYLILNSINVILKRFKTQKKLFYGSLIGSILSFNIFIPIFDNLIVIVLISILMVIISFGYKDFIYFKNNIIYFYMVSVIYGGFIYLINLKFNPLINENLYYERKIFINLIGLLIFAPIVYLLVSSMYKNIKNKKNLIYEVKLVIDKNFYEITGLYDTGNKIKDPYKKRPVILINKKILSCDIKNKSPIYVPCNLINGSVLIKCYKPKILIINNKQVKNCLIGVTDYDYSFDGVDAIISGYIGDEILC